MSADLKGPLRDLLDDPVAHEELERVRRRVHASRRLPPRARHWRWGPAAAAAVVLLATVGVWTWSAGSGTAPTDAGPVRLADGPTLRALRADEATRRVALHDGSWLRLAPGAALSAIENDGAHVLLAQGDGRVTYRVQPGGPRRWTVDAGALSVDVVGTRFVVERDGPRVRVEVARGRVRVRGAALEGGARTLAAGESIAVGPPDAEPRDETPGRPPTERDRGANREAGANDGRAVDDAAGDGRAADDGAPAVRARRPAPGRAGRTEGWRALADRGDWDGAFEAIGEDGLDEATRRARSVDELFALADTARLSGHPRLAVEPLERLMDEHATDARAAVAALTLGRLQLDALDAPASAVQSLERALRLGLPERLREPTLARLTEAHRRTGDAEAMRRVGARYLGSYPDGRNAARIRRWIGSTDAR
ncbi:MAG TPA: FecR domain-containing protein [Sandaracinaceae bacterium LLY-WYZ-13_1]|nr:FecR domain-containing protein [Sandaracinaceae bacterium LLY-WYZ-13_1]